MRIALLFVVAACAARTTPARHDPHAGWLRDYDQLRAYTTSSFANFEYRARTVPVDLPALDARTRAALARAATIAEAQAAIRAFVAAFHDAHFQVQPLAPRHGGGDAPAAPIPASSTPAAACAAMGVRPNRAPPIAWPDQPDFAAQYSMIAGLDAGVLFTAGGPVGVLRIPVLGGQYYPELCEQAWRARTETTACDATCQDALTNAMDQLLVDELSIRIRALVEARPRALLLDVTHDGGGTDVAVALARMLTDRVLGVPQLGYIRQPHWEKNFASAAHDFRAEVARQPGLTPQIRALFTTAAARGDAASVDAGTRCDASAVWKTNPPRFPCSPTGRFAGYADAAAIAAIPDDDLRSYFRSDAVYHYQPALWTGPLWLLVDRHSASATEELAAILQDYAGATVLGETTMGIGCGYTNGGTHVDLPALGLVAKAPDCIRFRADGTSESAGVRPQVAIDMTVDAGLAGRVEGALPATSP